MEVRAARGLEAVARILEPRLSYEHELRAKHELSTPLPDIAVSWITITDRELRIPVLIAAEPTPDGYLLSTYLERMIGTHAQNEGDAIALLDSPETAGELSDLVQIGADAYRRFDREAAAATIDTVRIFEEHLHLTSAYSKGFFEEVEAYALGRKTMSLADRETYAHLAHDLGAEQLKRDIVSRVRIELVAQHLGAEQHAVQIPDIGYRFAVNERATLLSVPIGWDGGKVIIGDEKASLPIIETIDELNAVLRTYPPKAAQVIGTALRERPQRFATADLYAREADEWLKIVS